MGIVRVVLDHEDYSGVDMGMAQRGYMRTIPGEVADEERLFLLPQGTYWKAEPTSAEQLRIDAHTAVREADELGAKIIATAGLTSWHGLMICADDEVR